MPWSQKYKDSIDCNHPKGFSQEQYCDFGRKKSPKKTSKKSPKKTSKKSPKKTSKKSPKGYNSTPTKKKTYFEKYDLYSDANPKDTIETPYKTKAVLKKTINKLERIYKSGVKPHTRIVKNANVLKQRVKVIYENTGKGKDRYELIKRYFDFLKQRTKIKNEDERKKMKFKA
jgi:hypothetical protein